MSLHDFDGGDAENSETGLPGIGDRPTYGTIQYEFGDPDIEHLGGTVVAVPEGFLVRAACHQCGWHDEKVFAVPAREECVDSNGVVRPAVGYSVFNAVRSHVETLAANQFPAHRPEEHAPTASLPSELLDLERRLIEHARRDLSEGKSVPATAHILSASGNTIPAGLAPSPDSTSSRRHRNELIEEAKAGVRALLHAAEETGAEVVGAVFLGEAWMAQGPSEDGAPPVPSEDPNRAEVLMVSTFTRHRGRSRCATIRRPLGVQEQGPGELGEWTDAPFVKGRLTDGLIAPVHEVAIRPSAASGRPGIDESLGLVN